MIVPIEKPGSPEELVEHFGIKGMHWGIRNQENSVSQPKTSAELVAQKEHRKEVAKKVAIGTGILIAVAGTAYVGYKLHQSGNLPFSSVKPSPKAEPEVKKFIEQTGLIHSARGKNKGFRFFQSGGVSDPIARFEEAFGRDGSKIDRITNEHFEVLPNGHIAAAFMDLKGRKDHAGRTIPHNIIIPKSMTDGISNLDDVKTKIWPILEKTYDPT